MTLLNDWLPENLLYAMGWTLVHSVWQLIIVAALLWGALKLFHQRSSHFKYQLAMGALGLSFVSAISTFLYEYSLFSPSLDTNFEALEALVLNAPGVPGKMGLESPLDTSIKWIETQLPLLVNIWFVGALLFMFRLVNSLSEIRMLRKSSVEVTDFHLNKVLYRMSDKMGMAKVPSLRLIQIGQSPVTFGFFKPVILLPAALLFHLSQEQLEAIVAHELAHIKRNDYLANLIQSSLEIMFFYHPCYWWMSQTVKELRENAADDLVVGAGVSPKELAHGLAEVLNFANQNPPELALAAGKRRNPTLQRIKRILGYPAQTYPQNPIISIPMLLTLLLSAGLMASAQQDTGILPDRLEPFTEALTKEASGLGAFDRMVSLKPFVAEKDTADRKVEISIIPDIQTDTVVSVGEDGSKAITVKKNIQFVGVNSDTLISNGDTLVLRGKGNSIFFGSPDIDWEMMPTLELGQIPLMGLNDVMVMPDFPKELIGKIPDDMVFPPMEPLTFDFEDGFPGFYHFDTTKLSKEEREKRLKKMEEWVKISEERALEWEAKWKEKEPEFKAKMEEWQQKMEPKLKEYEEKMKEWQEAQAPRMKEFEQRMKEWEKENLPKMEAYQLKMEEWQKEFTLKMEEFQKKMQEEYSKKDPKKN